MLKIITFDRMVLGIFLWIVDMEDMIFVILVFMDGLDLKYEQSAQNDFNQ